jgi:hypothetical protein
MMVDTTQEIHVHLSQEDQPPVKKTIWLKGVT